MSTFLKSPKNQRLFTFNYLFQMLFVNVRWKNICFIKWSRYRLNKIWSNDQFLFLLSSFSFVWSAIQKVFARGQNSHSRTRTHTSIHTHKFTQTNLHACMTKFYSWISIVLVINGGIFLALMLVNRFGIAESVVGELRTLKYRSTEILSNHQRNKRKNQIIRKKKEKKKQVKKSKERTISKVKLIVF